ncbi:hypothetical protein P781_18800 [Vibrio mimicus CAIM 1883]|nr:hypothetical protein P780_18880 [Vibrio mimicus CAIM 1882]ERM52762.1 hypothetical protein P781_18800 [Vibrio mimicus CAIM 1883]
MRLLHYRLSADEGIVVKPCLDEQQAKLRFIFEKFE